MIQKTIPVEIEFTEQILGTASSNPDIHREFIASKAPDAKTIEEEVESIGVDAVTEKSMTVFSRENGRPHLWNYQIKGFLKDACSMLARVPGTRSNKLKAYRKVIDGLVFVQPRKIFFPEGIVIGKCERPLRAQTAQGERIALASSETIPAGTRIKFEIMLMNEDLEATVKEWLEYGQFRGLGCWRNASFGGFKLLL